MSQGAVGLTPTPALVQAAVSATMASSKVAYKAFSIDMDVGVKVPVAAWFPIKEQEAVLVNDASFSDSLATYQESRFVPAMYSHRISIQRICQLLTGVDIVPKFVGRNFQLAPALTSGIVVNGDHLPLPQNTPVVILAHGYLGSRFDLSHLAEKLAVEGFTCIAPEYPESLAASFQSLEGLDRRSINDKLLGTLNKWGIRPSSSQRFGIVGHSLGCGTALSTGDSSWARVCVAGFPRVSLPGNVLFISSMNDGAVSLARFGGKTSIPSDYELLDEVELLQRMTARKNNIIPGRSFIVIDRPDGPNHISFLSEGVNNAMINLLSPLLPVARALNVPVLDFDRYQKSRDSLATAEVLHPIIIEYLKQQMKFVQK